MRLRVHHSLFAGFLGVIGLLVVLIVLSIGTGLRADLDEIYRRDLERQLNLAEALVASVPSPDLNSLARLITARVGHRVSFISPEGVVLGDSYVGPQDLPEVENHLERPEVQGVLRGEETSFAERTSATVGVPLLYGARLATVGGAPVVLRIAAPRDDIERAVDELQRTVALTGLVTMLLALVAAYWLSRAFTRPLVAMAARASQLAKGDFTSKVPLSRVAELQDLAVSFNRLTEELRTRLSELGRERDEMQTLIDCMAEGVVALTDDGRVLRINRAARSMLDLGEVAQFAPVGSVIRDESLRRALELSVSEPAQSMEIEMRGMHVLLASRALDSGGAVTTLLDMTELRHLEQVRRDFVANASHELKTPLTSIRGYAETLVDNEPPLELRKQFLHAIRTNTLRLQRLVDDLLELSRLESGRWSPAREPVDLAPIIWEAWQLLASQSEELPQLSVAGDAVVIGDHDGLFQVFRNLLENAKRHTPMDGHIRVEAQTDPVSGFAIVSVVDDGEGIPSKALPRIFERFYRADSSRARPVGGTGLGLAIVKHLVGAMGGQVEAKSALARGTTITFTVPLAGQD